MPKGRLPVLEDQDVRLPEELLLGAGQNLAVVEAAAPVYVVALLVTQRQMDLAECQEIVLRPRAMPRAALPMQATVARGLRAIPVI